MKIAFVLYDGMNMLDFVGFYEPISRLKNMELDEIYLDFCALKQEIKDSNKLTIRAKKVGESLDGYDVVFIPGGFSANFLRFDEIFIAWIKSSSGAKYKISASNGSLLLAAAGFLKDKKVATSEDYLEFLKPNCKELCMHNLVDAGNIITASNEISSLELGLYVCKILSNEEKSNKIRNIIHRF